MLEKTSETSTMQVYLIRHGEGNRPVIAMLSAPSPRGLAELVRGLGQEPQKLHYARLPGGGVVFDYDGTSDAPSDCGLVLPTEPTKLEWIDYNALMLDAPRQIEPVVVHPL